MVTDEELAKMCQEALEHSRKNPPLEDIPNERLRELAERMKEKKKALRTDLRKVASEYWKLKDAIRVADNRQRRARQIMGERNGKHCPCKAYLKEGEHYSERWTCEIRTQGYRNSYWDEANMYFKRCAYCKTSMKNKKKRLTWVRVFGRPRQKVLR